MMDLQITAKAANTSAPPKHSIPTGQWAPHATIRPTQATTAIALHIRSNILLPQHYKPASATALLTLRNRAETSAASMR